MKIYRNGQEAFCDKAQLKLMTDSGWSRKKPSEKVEEEKPEVADTPKDTEKPSDSPTPEDDKKETATSPEVDSAPKRKILKKKKD